MEITQREIKSRAAVGLKGLFLRSMATIFLALSCLLALKGIGVLLPSVLPISNTVLSPLITALYYFLFSVIEGAVVTSVLCWHYCEIILESNSKLSFIKAVKLSGLISIRVLFFGALFLLPSLILNFYSIAIKHSERFVLSDSLMLFLDVITVSVALLGGLFTIFFMVRYLLCPAILSENSAVSARVAIKASSKLMRGEKNGAFWFLLSFFPYLILSLLVIPAFYFLPKMVSMICIYQKYIIEKNRMSFPKLSYK